MFLSSAADPDVEGGRSDCWCISQWVDEDFLETGSKMGGFFWRSHEREKSKGLGALYRAFLYVHGSVHPVRIRIGQLGQNGHINDWTDIEKI